MARKKKEESGGGGSPAWMATFSDLMNLLLCFFVLLFAFSSVDAEKFAEISSSFSSSFSIFSGGAKAIGEGKLVSQGVSQMEYFSEYYSELGVAAGDKDASGEAASGEEEDDEINEIANEEKVIEDFKKQEEKLQKEKTEVLYEEVIEATEEKKLMEDVSIAMDGDYQFVQISLSGAILFDSGKDTFREEAVPILDKLGTILKMYDRYDIKIEGHTDNVPISNGTFKSNMWLSTARATTVFEYLTVKKGLNPKTLEASGRGDVDPIASNNTAEGRSKNRRVEIKIYSNTSS